MFEVGARAGHPTTTDIVARTGLWVGIALQAFAGHPSATDVVARPAVYYQSAGKVADAFPTQYAGLRIWDGAMVELCMVAEADAPSGMGGVLKIRKSVNRAIYLVETTDPNASNVRIKTTSGIKAIRRKT